MRCLLPLLASLLLLAAAAPLLAHAEYDGALLAPLGIDAARTNQDALLRFDPFSVSTFSPRLSLSVSNNECCDCVHTVAHHIIDSALESVATACANVTCPVIQQRCDWIKDHQDEYKGVLIVELRPITDGLMYCYGNGTCDHPGVPKSDMAASLLQADSSAAPQLLLTQISAAAPFIEQAMRTRVDSSAVNTTTNGDHKRSCHSCLRHGVRWVLKRSLKHLKAACEKTECPHFKQFCSWAKDHKEIVRGMVYAHVQPWKAASGYCAGRGDCHCGGDKDQSARSAPFTMGEHSDDDNKSSKPVIGGGEHDKVPHGRIHRGSIISKRRN